MQRLKLGGLDVSAQGLGCMGMSQSYGESDWDASVATIRRALELGVTLFDTADVYGAGHNEVLLGRALHGLRPNAQIATKFGVDNRRGRHNRQIVGDRDYVRASCEASLRRLGVEQIDLYYAHRPPSNVPLEETVGAMGELVDEGKVRFLGLSEATDGELRRAYAVHPIAAVQSEYSLWTRDPETVVLPALQDLGVGLVPYAPLGRGFLTDTVDSSSYGRRDYRAHSPRFVGEAEVANRALNDDIGAIAARLGVRPAEVALGWVHAQTRPLGIAVVPIPGTKRVGWLEQNVTAVDLELSSDDIATLDGLASRVVGARYAGGSAE